MTEGCRIPDAGGRQRDDEPGTATERTENHRAGTAGEDTTDKCRITTSTAGAGGRRREEVGIDRIYRIDKMGNGR